MTGQGQLRGTINITERSAEANDCAVPGYWEGYLRFGKAMRALATFVDRHPRRAANRPQADVVADALAARIITRPQQLRRSITSDHGKEIAQHARFSVDISVTIYFCDPRSPWQHGSNENTNGRLRQYVPKRSDLRAHTEDDVDAVAAELDNRPRQTLG